MRLQGQEFSQHHILHMCLSQECLQSSLAQLLGQCLIPVLGGSSGGLEGYRWLPPDVRNLMGPLFPGETLRLRVAVARAHTHTPRPRVPVLFPQNQCRPDWGLRSFVWRLDSAPTSLFPGDSLCTRAPAGAEVFNIFPSLPTAPAKANPTIVSPHFFLRGDWVWKEGNFSLGVIGGENFLSLSFQKG